VDEKVGYRKPIARVSIGVTKKSARVGGVIGPVKFSYNIV